MNQFTILVNNILTMSSREVAALCEKRHDHVLRDIENLNATYAQMGFPKVGEGYYTHPNWRKNWKYCRTKKGKTPCTNKGKTKVFFKKEF